MLDQWVVLHRLNHYYHEDMFQWNLLDFERVYNLQMLLHNSYLQHM